MESGKPRPKIWTVSELTASIKSLLERDFANVDLEAEISGFKAQASGHCYFTLKDSGAVISAVLFKWQLESCVRNRLIRLDQLRDGAKVKVRGAVSVYAQRGNYQIVVKLIRPVGEGELMRRYLELKARLGQEGLFDPSRKRPLPFLARRIGIVSSESGAVIHDMCTVLTRRFPAVEIRLFPAAVQGAEAPCAVIAGLDYFNQAEDWRADLLIVARGGGSFEDLFCFNDEALVRAVAASAIPVISAVGHETDFTLCDFAADRRAGTPSIAAEIAVPVQAELIRQLSDFELRLQTSLKGRGEYLAQRIDHLSDSLVRSLTLVGERLSLRLERVCPRLEPALRFRLQSETSRLATAAAKLEAYSPFGVLKRGYSLTTTADGSVVKDGAVLRPGDELHTRFAAGGVVSVVSRSERIG